MLFVNLKKISLNTHLERFYKLLLYYCTNKYLLFFIFYGFRIIEFTFLRIFSEFEYSTNSISVFISFFNFFVCINCICYAFFIHIYCFYQFIFTFIDFSINLKRSHLFIIVKNISIINNCISRIVFYNNFFLSLFSFDFEICNFGILYFLFLYYL